MKKILVIITIFFATISLSSAKETTFKKELFDKALSNGKVVVVVRGLNIVRLVQVK